jgi:hypothetical protein
MTLPASARRHIGAAFASLLWGALLLAALAPASAEFSCVPGAWKSYSIDSAMSSDFKGDDAGTTNRMRVDVNVTDVGRTADLCSRHLSLGGVRMSQPDGSMTMPISLPLSHIVVQQAASGAVVSVVELNVDSSRYGGSCARFLAVGGRARGSGCVAIDVLVCSDDARSARSIVVHIIGLLQLRFAADGAPGDAPHRTLSSADGARATYATVESRFATQFNVQYEVQRHGARAERRADVGAAHPHTGRGLDDDTWLYSRRASSRAFISMADPLIVDDNSAVSGCMRDVLACAVLELFWSLLSSACCAVLCCAVLCCAVLCCAVLCCAVLFHRLCSTMGWVS